MSRAWPWTCRLRPDGGLRTEVEPASVPALAGAVLVGLVRIAAHVQPPLQLLRGVISHAKAFGDERRVLKRVALRRRFRREAAEVERLVRQRLRGPRGSELLVRAVAPLEAREVEAVEMAERLARLGREVGVVVRPPVVVELHVTAFGSNADERAEEAGAADADLAPRQIARDGGELVLLADPVLVSPKADRRQRADDQEEGCHESHRPRIGTGPDGL